MVATWNTSADANYYTRNYYLGAMEAGDAWFAPSRSLGVSTGAPVNPAVFNRLFEGVGSDGRALFSDVGRSDRVPAFDITLSAPRSVSLIWGLAAPDLKADLEEALRRASVATLVMLDREAMFARRGKGGAVIEKVSATAATFLHGESRPARHADGSVFEDPNLHTHNVFLNLAQRPDGTFGAIHSAVLRDYKMAAGGVFHAELSFELLKLGFVIDRVGKNGIFEIAGVPDSMIDYFSARRNEIREELAASGTTSAADPAMASFIAKTTRGFKTKPNGTDREDVWKAAAAKFQVQVDFFSETLPKPTIERNAAESEAMFAMRLTDAVAELTATESVVRRQDVIRSVAAALVGTGLSAERVPVEVAQLIDDGRVVQVGEDTIGLPLYSTPDVIAIERSVEQTASSLADSEAFALDPHAVKKACERDRLSDEQADAVLAVTSGGSIAVVEGSAGSGKTTLLRSVVSSYQAEGYRVVGTATAWQAAHTLKEDLGIDARSTASLLHQLETGKRSLDARTVVVVDEAGLIPSRDMAAFLRAVEHATAKVILVGDRRQLQPIGAGPALGIVAGVVEAKRVDTIVRQNEEWARTAITDFRDGRTAEALEAFSERGHVVETGSARAAIVAAVDSWHETPIHGSKLLIAKTNLQVAALNREVRLRLRESGYVRGDDVVISAATPSGHAAELVVAVGDHIRFQTRNDALQVVNGTNAIVIGIKVQSASEAATGPRISIEAVIGKRTVSFSPENVADSQGRALLGHAYATTVYGSQGLTVDRATVLLDATFNRHEAYVAASRARRETKLVIDGAAIDRQLNRDPVRIRVPSLITGNERFTWLAKRLSRENRKVSTVEVIAAAKGRKVAPLSSVYSTPARTRDQGVEI